MHTSIILYTLGMTRFCEVGLILLSVEAARSILVDHPVTRGSLSKDSLRDGNMDGSNSLTSAKNEIQSVQY